MAGMVNAPVVTVLAMDDPEIVPINALEKIATLAGPPEYRPAITIAKSMNNCPRPMRVARTPNRMKRNTYCAMTPIAMP